MAPRINGSNFLAHNLIIELTPPPDFDGFSICFRGFDHCPYSGAGLLSRSGGVGGALGGGTAPRHYRNRKASARLLKAGTLCNQRGAARQLVRPVARSPAAPGKSQNPGCKEQRDFVKTPSPGENTKPELGPIPYSLSARYSASLTRLTT